MASLSGSSSKRKHDDISIDDDERPRSSVEDDCQELYGGDDFRPFVVGPPTPDQLAFRDRSQATFELHAQELVKALASLVRSDPPDSPQRSNDGDADATSRSLLAEAKYLPACLEFHRLMALNSSRYEADNRAGSWTMACGDNEMGVLGIHLKGRRQNEATTIRLVNPNLFRADVRQVSCGAMASAALSGTGIAYTFGSSDQGALGRVPEGVDPDHTLLWEATPSPLDDDSAPPGIRQVGCGNLLGLALTEDGRVFTWGCYEDANNQRFRTLPTNGVGGSGSGGWNDTPVQVPGLKDILQVYTGPAANFCYALDVHGTLYSWGFGNCGETGRISRIDPQTGKPSAMFTLYTVEENENKVIWEDVLQEFLIPRPVPLPSKDVISVACGGSFVLVVARDQASFGITYAAGNNGFGQLGNGNADKGSEANQLELRPIKALENVNMGKVAAGDRHCLALSQDLNSLYAWGATDKGQLGLGEAVANQVAGYVATPTVVTFHGRSSPCQIVDVACGEVHSMARSLDGDVYTWGYTDGEDKMYTGHACKPGKDVYVPMKLEMKDPKAGPAMEAIDMAGGSAGSLFLVRARADPPDEAG